MTAHPWLLLWDPREQALLVQPSACVVLRNVRAFLAGEAGDGQQVLCVGAEGDMRQAARAVASARLQADMARQVARLSGRCAA